MPLLLVDLDNTLIDRAGAFDRWAREFAAAHGGGSAGAAWLTAADRDGLEPRPRFAGMIAERFGLAEQGEMEGARGVGLPGVWLHRGRPWPLTAFEPGHVAGSFPHAVDIVLDS